jgi:hypothetical protein
MSRSTRGSRQTGMSLLGFVFWVGLAAFFMTIGLKMGPLYLNYWTIRGIMEDVAKDPEPIEGGQRAIANKIDRFMNINSVANLSIKDFVIKKIAEGTYNVTVDYEQRVRLFFNVDGVAAFSYQVEVKAK